MTDDIMDDTETRRTRQSWHKKQDVGIHAINDSILLEASIYEILERYFKDHSYYPHIVALFREVRISFLHNEVP